MSNTCTCNYYTVDPSVKIFRISSPSFQYMKEGLNLKSLVCPNYVTLARASSTFYLAYRSTYSVMHQISCFCYLTLPALKNTGQEYKVEFSPKCLFLTKTSLQILFFLSSLVFVGTFAIQYMHFVDSIHGLCNCISVGGKC